MDTAEAPARAPVGIRAAAAELRVSPHTLRYYEDLGLVHVGRDAAGHRLYDADALARLTFLVRMRASGMGMRDLRRYVDLVEHGPDTVPERVAMLRAHRAGIHARMTELRHALDLTEHKLRAYGA